MRGRRRAPAGNAVRLLHEHGGDPCLGRRSDRGRQVGRADAAAGSVAEHEERARRCDLVHVEACRTVRCLELRQASRYFSSQSADARIVAISFWRFVKPWPSSSKTMYSTVRPSERSFSTS